MQLLLLLGVVIILLVVRRIFTFCVLFVLLYAFVAFDSGAQIKEGRKKEGRRDKNGLTYIIGRKLGNNNLSRCILDLLLTHAFLCSLAFFLLSMPLLLLSQHTTYVFGGLRWAAFSFPKISLPPSFWLIAGFGYDWMGNGYFVYRDHWRNGHTPIMPKGKKKGSPFSFIDFTLQRRCRRPFFLLPPHPPKQQQTQPTTLSIYYAHVYEGEETERFI